ncbi:NAD(P)-dependent oxidoreductase [Marinivivus vitaminiproducens]|uniref:NAD(P)-dependent oxidoreductase n=1 Tax=Marinivivus vitaminiproducens TaxID=3035935 RepID=UPI0027A7C1F4|nr:NAD(P)-dependent oxidoreductase [Geminicoccaceae bacterium SCSIO 64248]
MSERRTIGFIGLGNMGVGFTRRLVASGCEVIGYDIDTAKVDAARAWNVAPAASPADVARAADLIFVCVVSTQAVETVVLGEDGIATIGRAEGKIVVDVSTTEIEVTKRLAAELADRCGVAFVDAPCSGGPGAAEEGRLAVMAGGEEAVIEAVRPVMDLVASRFTRMGEVGAGQATKLVNQALVLTNYVVIAESIALGRRLGVDVGKIPHALGTGYAGGNLLNDLVPRMVENDFAPRGFARQVLKDFHLLGDAAKSLNLAMPMASEATTLYRMMISQGLGELDGAAIVTLLDTDGTTKRG